MQNKKLKIQVFYQNFEKWTKLVQCLIICEASSNQKSNPKEFKYIYEYSISFSLPWQSYVWDIQTVGTASPSTTEFFLLVKYGWRFHYAFFSVWSYKEIDVQFWLRAQTGHWLEFGPRDLGTGKPNLNHRKYNIVNL